MLAAWALELPGMVPFVSIVSMLLSLGFASTQLTLGLGGVTQKVVGEMQQEEEAAREKALDDLDKKLQMDGDLRTEQMLRDLRKLTSDFRRDSLESQMPEVFKAEIQVSVQQLFDATVRSLGESWRLWSLARELSETARQPLLARREEIVEDVAKSLKTLSEILVHFRDLSVMATQNVDAMKPLEEGQTSEMADLRERLNENLEVARKADARVRASVRNVAE